MWEKRITEAIQKLLVGFLVVFFIMFAIRVSRYNRIPATELNKNICIQLRATEYKGIVIENRWSRGSFISTLDNDKLFSWRCKSKVRDIIEVGDSIYKPSGTFDTYIYKKANPDSLIFIECDFDCDFWENIK